jgi:hypothetical protein
LKDAIRIDETRFAGTGCGAGAFRVLRSREPFGGGGAITTSLGGGGTSFGGGGSSFFFISTNSTFSALGFSSCSLASSVPYTAPAPRRAWMIPLIMRPPVVRCFFGFDSIRLLNMSALT